MEKTTLYEAPSFVAIKIDNRISLQMQSDFDPLADTPSDNPDEIVGPDSDGGIFGGDTF